jgi:anti-sigma B factor antagonist
MKLTSSQFKYCDLVKVEGRIDSYTASQLGEKLDEIIKEGRFKIVLDLEKVDFMSSAGLRVLINTQKTCKRYNRGEIVLTAVPQNIYSALELAGFTSLFRILADSLIAVGNF